MNLFIFISTSPFINRTFFQLDIIQIKPYILSIRNLSHKDSKMISNLRKSSLCVSFNGKFANMRKEQSFVIYPVAKGDNILKIQSDGRFGFLDKNGKLLITSKNCQYPNSQTLMAEVHLKTAKEEIIPENEMTTLREFLKTTTLGNEWVTVVSDNSGAKEF